MKGPLVGLHSRPGFAPQVTAPWIGFLCGKGWSRTMTNSLLGPFYSNSLVLKVLSFLL